MHPALRAQLLRLLLPIVTAPAAACANDAPVDEALSRCAALADDTQRLTCYDALAGRAPRTPSAQVTPTGSPSEEAQVPPAPSDLPTGDASPAAEQEAATRIVGIEERPRGERIFLLENGERWTEPTRERTRFRVGDVVTLRRTSLGGAMLVRQAGGATRVRAVD